MAPDPGTLSDDAQRRLRDWQITLWELDSRYGDKGLLALAAISLADEESRARLITDPQNVIAELGITLELPESTTVRFVENTPNTLTVILPPRAAEEEARPAELDQYLESRPAKVTAFLRDDFNYTHVEGDHVSAPPGDISDGQVLWGGDPETRDT